MADALTAPFAAAALVLCVAGVAKLRAPAVAVAAVATLGLTGKALAVRGVACAELGIGLACLLHPSAATAIPLACTYTCFCAIALVLADRRSSCGCFGEDDTPASRSQSMLSAALALVGLATAIAPAHGVGWMLGRPAASAAVLMIGIAGSAYGLVLAYTALPRAWSSWSAG